MTRLACLLGLALAQWLCQAVAQTAPGTPVQAVVLAVSVNGLAGDQGVIFKLRPDGHLLAPTSFLNEWHLAWGAPQENTTAHTGGDPRHVDLGDLPGVTFVWDHRQASLAIRATPEAFLPSQVNASALPAQKATPYAPGGFLNYDLSVVESPHTQWRQALVNVGLFQGGGLFTNSFTVGTAGGARLMTTYETDQTDSLMTWRLGDSSNHTGAWGQGVLFGGLQVGTNFAMRPDFVPMAMPSVSGRALLPSTVDVYINNALRSRQQVDAGPFAIQNLPVISGAGDVQLVVRDVLGREQVITQPFFTTPEVLRQGLVDVAFELGWLRDNLGQASNDYSSPFAALTYRKGLTSQLTTELRVELQPDATTAGLSGAVALPAVSSVLGSSLALSRSQDSAQGESGALLSADYGYAGRRFSANARLQWNQLGFRQLGSNPERLLQQSGVGQVSVPLGQGTLSVNYLRHQTHGQPLVRLLNLNHSLRLAKGVQASLSLFKPLSPNTPISLGLMLTVLLDPTHVASASAQHGHNQHSLGTDFQQTTPPDGGAGYRLATLNSEQPARQEATVMRNTPAGRVQADVLRQNDTISARLGFQGGLALLDGHMHVAPRLDEGFAVVRVLGAPGLPVSLDNQVVAHTNAKGRAIVTHLRPYQDNRISIDPLALRLSTSVNQVVHTVVPRRQGGVLVDFEAHQVRAITLTLVDPSGLVLPPWTPVQVAGVSQIFVVGQHGQVYLELPQRPNNLVTAQPINGTACNLQVSGVVNAQAIGSASEPSFLEPQTCTPLP